MPAQMPMPQAEDPSMWASIKGIIGKTAGDFVNSLGDTPEERQRNLEVFTKSIGTINQLGTEVGQSTLMQRLGAKKGTEMVQSQAQAAQAAQYAPLPPLNSDMMANIMNDVGLGVRGIQESTGRDIRR
jgi:hypothetical protein